MIRKVGRYYWLDTRIHGRRARRSLHTDNYHQAKLEAARIEAELRAQAEAAASPGIREFAARYLEWARLNKTAKTAKDEAYRLDVILPFLEGLGVKALRDLSPYHVEQLRAHLAEGGRGKTTINRYTQLLRGMIYRAKDWRLFEGENPLRRVRFYREGKKVRPLAEAQLAAALAAADEMAARKWASPLQRVLPDLCRLILNTGLRRGEALRLKWDDIRGGEIHVVGKGGKARDIPLNGAAKAILARLPRRGEYVFDVPYRDSAGALRRATETISKTIGTRFWLHALRHDFATRLLAKGCDIVTLGELLGHSAAMVSLLYAHTGPARKRQAVDLLG